jgi:GNAT superfamily N-acetyltransferase
VSAAFRIEPFGTGIGRKEFSSGVAALDRYLHEIASQDIRRRLSNCFIARDSTGKIAGYYTFAAGSVPLHDLPESETKRLPRYAVLPAGLIGRLAVDQNFRGRGLRGSLIIDAARRGAVADPAIFALIVDAKDEQAGMFYRHLGFQPFNSRPMSYYLPIATLLAGLE